MSNDETELIAQILDGNKDAYRTLVDRHKQGVYRHCFYIVQDEDVAEDMAQEAFIRAYECLAQFDHSRAAFKTWLITIATRLCLRQLRRSRKSLPMDDSELLVSDRPSPYQQAIEREMRDAVLRLRPKYRAVVTLHYWHGYSYEDIAAAMKVPVGSVRGWLHRAKKQLKEALL